MDNNIQYNAGTEEPSKVPHLNWQAYDQIDWSVLWIFAGIIVVMYGIGFLMGMLGPVLGVSVVWFGFLVYGWGINSLFVNPLYVISVSLILGCITVYGLRLVRGVLMFPTQLYRHFTR